MPAWPSSEAFVALYNAATPDDHPKVTLLSPQRRKHIEGYVAIFPGKHFGSKCMPNSLYRPFSGAKNRARPQAH